MILDVGCEETKHGDAGLDTRKLKGIDVVGEYTLFAF